MGERRGPPRSAACTGEDTNRQVGRIERGGVESDRDRDRDRDGGGDRMRLRRRRTLDTETPRRRGGRERVRRVRRGRGRGRGRDAPTAASALNATNQKAHQRQRQRQRQRTLPSRNIQEKANTQSHARTPPSPRSLRAGLHDAADELAEPGLEAPLVEHARGVEEGVVPARGVRAALGEQRLAGARGAEVGDGEGVVRRLFGGGGERARGEGYPLCDDLWAGDQSESDGGRRTADGRRRMGWAGSGAELGGGEELTGDGRRRTRLSNVFRLPTKTMSPSMK